MYFAMTFPFSSTSNREIEPDLPWHRNVILLSTVSPISIDCRKLSAVPCETMRILSRSFSRISL